MAPRPQFASIVYYGVLVRLLYVSNELPPHRHGGLGTAVMESAKLARRSGHETSIVGVFSPALAGITDTDDGVSIVRLSATRVPHVGWAVNRKRLLRFIEGYSRKYPESLIEIPDYAAPAGIPKPGLPVVMRLYGPSFYLAPEFEGPLGLTAKLERRALQRARYWIAPTQHALDEIVRLSGATPERAWVVPYPVDVEYFGYAWSPTDPPTVCFAGSVTERKGALTLADAIPRVVREVPTARFVYAGKDTVDPRFGSVSAEVRKRLPAEVVPQVEFRGHVDQGALRTLYRESTVMALPSASETFGIVWAEAMASGCPVIGTSDSCGVEVIGDSSNGLLVRSGDSEALAEAILKILTRPALAANLSKCGRRRVDELLSQGAVAQQLDAAYSAIANAYAGNYSAGW